MAKRGGGLRAVIKIAKADKAGKQIGRDDERDAIRAEKIGLAELNKLKY